MEEGQATDMPNQGQWPARQVFEREIAYRLPVRDQLLPARHDGMVERALNALWRDYRRGTRLDHDFALDQRRAGHTRRLQCRGHRLLRCCRHCRNGARRVARPPFRREHRQPWPPVAHTWFLARLEPDNDAIADRAAGDLPAARDAAVMFDIDIQAGLHRH